MYTYREETAMVFTESDRLEREERRKLYLEHVSHVMCPRCGITVTLSRGEGECELCRRHPHEGSSDKTWTK